MSEVQLTSALRSHAVELASISRAAFHTDVQCGGPPESGPSGYDLPDWQAWMMGKALRYFEILVDGHLAGGLIIFRAGPGHYELGRIFVSPEHQGKGVGKQAIRLLFGLFPECSRWTLETPAWNTRTRHFYAGLGFRVLAESDCDVCFVREM